MAFDGRGPASYVDFLLRPGLQTHVGRVPLSAYVSGRQRSPLAASLLSLMEGLLNRFSDSTLDQTIGAGRRRPRAFEPRRWAGPLPTGPSDPLALGMNQLEQMRDQIRASDGRPSAWRSVFSGQGMPDDITAVMNFLVDQGPLMLSACGRDHALRPYFSEGRLNVASLRHMVSQEVFGLDCLGFVGTYLAWCGAEPRYPRLTQSQYETVLHWSRVDSLSEIEDRCALLWLQTGTQHIAIIDRVTARDARSITVDLCQSSAGGPQTNVGVRLSRAGDAPARSERSRGGGYFRVAGGEPAVPVGGQEVLVIKRRSW